MAGAVAAISLLLSAPPVWAQAESDASPSVTVPPLTLDAIGDRRKTLEAVSGLDEAARTKADGYYGKALEVVRTAAEYADRAERYTKAMTTAPEETARLRSEAANPVKPGKAVSEEATGLSLDEAVARLRDAEAKSTTASAALRELVDELVVQQARPLAINAALAEASTKVNEIAGELEAAPLAGEAQDVTEARRMLLHARQQMREAELRMLRAEHTSYDVRVALLTERRNAKLTESTRLTERTRNWQAVVLRVRESEAARATAEATAEAAKLKNLPAPVREIAEWKVELAQKVGELAVRETALAERLNRLETRRAEIEREYTANAQRIELAARSETVGLLLRRQRDALPDLRAYRKASLRRRDEVAALVVGQIEADQQRRELVRDPVVAARAVVDTIEPLPAGDERKALVAQVIELQKERGELLATLYEAQSRYLGSLNELDLVEQQTTAVAREYAELIDKHLLWLRSASPVGSQTVRNSGPALGWLVSGDGWSELTDDVIADARRQPIVWVLGLGGVVLLIAMRRWARRRLVDISQHVGRVTSDSFVLTLRALVLTAVAAVGWAALAGFVGWRLMTGIESGAFTQAIGAALVTAAILWATLALVREMCAKGGLGVAHFRWPEAARAGLRRDTVWLLMIVVPAGFIAAATNRSGETAHIASLGRIAYIVGMIAGAVFVFRLLRPGGAVTGALIRRRGDGWLARLRWIWFPLAVGVPIALAALSAFGYLYTAFQLSWRLLATVWLVLVLMIAHATMLRALFVAARRLAFAEAKRRREEEKRRREEEAEKGDETEADALPPVEIPEISVDQISEHTRKLVQLLIVSAAMFGLWIAWSDALPALALLNDMHIAGSPLTVGMAALFVLAIVVTVIAARNLPGVLEITLLTRLPLDAGARYAITSLSRYVIVAVGIIAAFNALGVNWDSVQWLVAALGVGLGFGLQEIVANFVSGIIILFERPFRVGDFVTVNEVEGWVTRIRIRATTITTQERRELIVPNKEFITGQIINWSLSEPIIRLSVNVGIAYGADTDTAERCFLEAARENSGVLEHPEPRALFLGFGDNSLNYDVRIWIDDVAARYDIIHAMHKTIDRKCRDADVCIAFPQRDVHLDQIGPLKVQLDRSARESTE